MGEIHTLVQQHGRDRARNLVPSSDRYLVDLAAEVLGEERLETSYLYSGFCMSSLPHRAIPTEGEWVRKSDNFTLIVEPGKLFDVNGDGTLVGIPYGPKARLLLMYLQSEAIKTGSPEIEMGRNMHRWLEKVGVSVGGVTYKAFREQARRITACRLTFTWRSDDKSGFRRDQIIDAGTLEFQAGDATQPKLWVETVRLGDRFYQALKKHPVPLWAPAVALLADKSQAIDVYSWLAYRLHSLHRQTPVSWPALHQQFGSGYKEIRQFRAKFLETLRETLVVYPEARVSVEAGGLILYPSPPPVTERSAIAS